MGKIHFTPLMHNISRSYSGGVAHLACSAGISKVPNSAYLKYPDYSRALKFFSGRRQKVADCIELFGGNLAPFGFMPQTPSAAPRKRIVNPTRLLYQ